MISWYNKFWTLFWTNGNWIMQIHKIVLLSVENFLSLSYHWYYNKYFKNSNSLVLSLFWPNGNWIMQIHKIVLLSVENFLSHSYHGTTSIKNSDSFVSSLFRTNGNSRRITITLLLSVVSVPKHSFFLISWYDKFWALFWTNGNWITTH